MFVFLVVVVVDVVDVVDVVVVVVVVVAVVDFVCNFAFILVPSFDNYYYCNLTISTPPSQQISFLVIF